MPFLRHTIRLSFAPGASRSLLRRWKSVPLPILTQGSTLSITSTLTAPTDVVVCPEWRDSGHVELVQSLSPSPCPISEVEMTVVREADLKTPLGRYEPHLSIRLSSAVAAAGRAGTTNEQSNSPTASGRASSLVSDAVHHYLPSKKIDRVILDDGSIQPDSLDYKSLPGGMKRVEYHDGMAHITTADDVVPSSDEATADDGELNPSPVKDGAVVVTIRIPEKLNLNCDLRGTEQDSMGGGSITVRGKLEGNIRLMTCGGGNISVTKLRGHTIELESTGGDFSDECVPTVFVRDLVEAQSLSVACSGRFRAKQLHGRSIQVSVNHRGGMKTDSSPSSKEETPPIDSDDERSLVDIGALFVSGGRDGDGGGGGGGASIRVTGSQERPRLRRRAVRVKSHHGALEVMAESLSRPTVVDPYTHETYPLVELGGVNGSFEVTIHGGEKAATTATPTCLDQDWTSCKVHVDSLHPESVSLVTADQGDVSLTLDRKAEADLRLMSSSSPSTLREAGAALAEEEDSELLLRVLQHLPHDPPTKGMESPRISIHTQAFQSSGRRLGSDDGSIEYREGHVENRSDEPDSRFDRRRSPGRGGKIRLDGAEAQALRGFARGPSDGSKGADGGGGGRGVVVPASGPSHGDGSTDRPLVAVAAAGRIGVETVSWIGAIARRYGLEDAGPRGIGRTASRRGRPIATGV